MLVILMSTGIFSCSLHKFQPVGLTGGSLKVKVLFPFSVLEVRRLVNFGIFSSEDLALSLLWSSLAENSLFMVV